MLHVALHDSQRLGHVPDLRFVGKRGRLVGCRKGLLGSVFILLARQIGRPKQRQVSPDTEVLARACSSFVRINIPSLR